MRAGSDQLQVELLCQDCERILNDGGEKWIHNKFCTVDRVFPLYDLLKRKPPLFSDDDGETFAAASNPDIDVQKICHFALGVFWKASLYPWEFGEISLSPHAEGLRTWLRGESSFPQEVALNVILSRPTAAQIVMNPPYSTGAPWETYLFHVPGILFRLSVGNEIPTDLKTLCFHSSAEHFIVVSDSVTRKIFQANATEFNKSEKTRSYRKAREKQRKLASRKQPPDAGR